MEANSDGIYDPLRPILRELEKQQCRMGYDQLRAQSAPQPQEEKKDEETI